MCGAEAYGRRVIAWDRSINDAQLCIWMYRALQGEGMCVHGEGRSVAAHFTKVVNTHINILSVHTHTCLPPLLPLGAPLAEPVQLPATPLAQAAVSSGAAAAAGGAEPAHVQEGPLPLPLPR